MKGFETRAVWVRCSREFVSGEAGGVGPQFNFARRRLNSTVKSRSCSKWAGSG